MLIDLILELQLGKIPGNIEVEKHRLIIVDTGDFPFSLVTFSQ